MTKKGVVLLLNSILTTFQWFFSIGAKLVRIVPGYTFAVVIATLLSQVSLLLAFFLPLKVIILLGSPGIPRYFPSSWQALDRNYLVISLAASAAGFYLLYLLAERLIIYGSELGARHLLENSKKITLFKNQGELALRAYQRYARSLAGAVFVGLALIATGALYSSLVLAVIGYVLFVFLLLLLTCTFSQRIRIRLNQNINGLGAIVAAVGFLLAFIFMVLDFMVAPAPGVIEAVISLLLVRQLMNRLVGLSVDLNALYTQRLQINALFFHGHPLVAELPQHERVFWPLLESPRREEWVRNVLHEVAACDPGRFECNWHQTGSADVVAFEVTARDYSEQPLGQHLIKLFNNNRKSLAEHEASLLAEGMPRGFPALQFLGADSVGSYQCNVFKWSGGQKFLPRQMWRMRLDMLNKLIALEPEKHIVAQYYRSRPMLAQRLTETVLDRLCLVAGNSQSLKQVEELKRNIGNLQARLDALPVQIFNPDMNADTLLNAEGDELILTHWGRWSIEPIGAGWPAQEKELAMLDEALISARKHRPTLINVTVNDVRLAALIFAIENFYIRQQYVNALELLPSVLACIENGDFDPGTERG